MPAAAVIPALLVYAKVAAVKALLLGARVRVVRRAQLCVACARPRGYHEKSVALKASCAERSSMG